MITTQFYETAVKKSLELTQALHDGDFSTANALAVSLTQMSRSLELDKEQADKEIAGVIV